MGDISKIRRRAWETRRQKYGPGGHAGSYSRAATCCSRCEALLGLIIRLHSEAVLSEGQVAKATGLHRIEIRRMTDDYNNRDTDHDR